MDTKFMNSGNSKTSDPRIILLDLSYEINLKRIWINMLLFEILAFTINSIFLAIIQKNKFKISALTWNEGFQLPDGSYSASNIKDYFEYF